MDSNGVILTENFCFGSSSLIEIAIVCCLLGFAGIGKTSRTNGRNQDISIIVSQILHRIQRMAHPPKGNGFRLKQNLTNRHLLRSYTGFFKINAVFRYPICRPAVFGLYQTGIF